MHVQISKGGFPMTMANIETNIYLAEGIIFLIISVVYLQKLDHMLLSNVPHSKGERRRAGILALLGAITWTLCIAIIKVDYGTEFINPVAGFLYYCTVFIIPLSLHLLVKLITDPIRERLAERKRLYRSRSQIEMFDDAQDS